MRDVPRRLPVSRVASLRITALLMLAVGLSSGEVSAVSISLEPYATGLSSPVAMAACGDGRLFVVEKAGTIRVVQAGGSVNPAPFLDISARVGSAGSEQGLLGLAFHPAYAVNGFFYVNYTDTAGNTSISRFSVSGGNPDVALAGSEFQILAVAQPFSNHNGGALQFGPDGYLYIGLGDGGSGGDPQDRAQNPADLLGKILRIDVDGGSPYAIPPGNPLVGVAGSRPEIWAMGLRNPWRFSFDRQTGDFWIGDVGQNLYEEVDFQPASSGGGENYGWRCYEGNHAYNLTGCGGVGNYIFPVFEYSHGPHCSITGGYVYRGIASPLLQGNYLLADYCSGQFWTVTPGLTGGYVATVQPVTLAGCTTFGEGSDGELYVASLSVPTIYRIRENSLAAPSLTNAAVLLLLGLQGLAMSRLSQFRPRLVRGWRPFSRR